MRNVCVWGGWIAEAEGDSSEGKAPRPGTKAMRGSDGAAAHVVVLDPDPVWPPVTHVTAPDSEQTCCCMYARRKTSERAASRSMPGVIMNG